MGIDSDTERKRQKDTGEVQDDRQTGKTGSERASPHATADHTRGRVGRSLAAVCVMGAAHPLRRGFGVLALHPRDLRRLERYVPRPAPLPAHWPYRGKAALRGKWSNAGHGLGSEGGIGGEGPGKLGQGQEPAMERR
jgi:hypothetical protein